MMEPERAGMEIALRMLDTPEAMNPHIDPLHQRPDALDAVRMSLATDRLPALMVHSRQRIEADQRGYSSPTYQRIRQDRAQGGLLYTYLRQRGKATRGSAGRDCIPGRRDISERPAIVDSKQHSGDWEAYTILGKAHKGGAVTLVERKSRYLLSQTVRRKTAALVGAAMQNLLRPSSALALTLTCDNGKEVAGHRQTAAALDTDIFLARPYRSCERGLNEHTNALLRQFVPKTENLRTLDPQRLQEAINRPNHRPRKVLGYRTPYEVFREDCLAAGVDPPLAAPDPCPL